ncbi:transmembrane protein 216 isoform X2 [Crotalus tigris]|uniref:transmembrane protein 216 isoform X2 n=1 Tax=Crotalus tigris TaxID=88082 RepID=UPI00192F729A|nr:transmembrane protein 216 isoform X2 [Crotalus tigris]
MPHLIPYFKGNSILFNRLSDVAMGVMEGWILIYPAIRSGTSVLICVSVCNYENTDIYINILVGPSDRQLSSTPLEILLFLNGWYYATYFLLEIFIFVYKGLLLPYPSANLALDLVMLFLYLGIEVTRIFFGSKGNLCQRKVPLAVSLALTFPAAVMAAYYLLLQTYALRLEAILNAILLFFYAVELLLGILTLASFSRA